jgi:hypothetical protein
MNRLFLLNFFLYLRFSTIRSLRVNGRFFYHNKILII